MQSTIHQSERLANQSHQFGESADDYRYPALFIRDDGTEQILLFTPAQVNEARNRAIREHEDVAVLTRRMQEGRRQDRIIDIVLLLGLVSLVAVVAVILKW